MPKAIQLARMLNRASRASDPIVYPSESPGLVSIVAYRKAYRKGPATLVINEPLPESGIHLKRGNYLSLIDKDVEYESIKLMPNGKNDVRIEQGKAKFSGSLHPAQTLQKTGSPDGFTLRIEDGFYKAILKTSVILFHDHLVIFYCSDQCNPLYVGKLPNGKLNGIIIPTPMARSLLREAFYHTVTFHPTALRQKVGGTFTMAGVSDDGLGVAISVKGEDGETYTILQPGSILAS